MEPKIAYFDLENAPHKVFAWELYDTNAIAVIKESYLLSFAVQWEGQQKITTYALPDYKGYKHDKENDEHLVRDLWKMMNEADILIAHNGDRFDIRKANARFIKYGLRPPAPSKTVDTLKIARRVAMFPSNKLDSLAKDLGIGRKLPHTGFSLWEGCMAGDEKAWRVMRKYNAHDVELLRGVYLKLRPWGVQHPDMTLFEQVKACPRCRSTKYQARGFIFLTKGKKRRFQCNECGHWFAEKRK